MQIQEGWEKRMDWTLYTDKSITMHPVVIIAKFKQLYPRSCGMHDHFTAMTRVLNFCAMQ